MRNQTNITANDFTFLNQNNSDDDEENDAANKADNKKSEHKEIKFRMLANFDFNYENAKEQILKLDSLEQMPNGGFDSDTEKTIFFYNLLNFECKHTIRSIGALLIFLKRNNSYFNNRDFFSSNKLTEIPLVKSFQQMQVDNLLLMDQNTFKSLQIFNDTDLMHANRQVDREYARNFRSSLSFNINAKSTLYSLYLSKISTKMGINKLRSFMLKPVRNEAILNERHRMIDFFMDHSNRQYVDLYRKTLKKCKFINAILKKIRIIRLNWNEWKKLYNTTVALYNVATIAVYASKKISQKQTDSMNPRRALDSESSASTSHFFNMPKSIAQISAMDSYVS
jgi:DNA mismatch repair ATPase MutS